MLDVVYGLYYGDELFELKGADTVLRDMRRIENVSVPRPWVAMFLFGLHVCLDKGLLSSANRERGQRMATEAMTESPLPDAVHTGFGASSASFAYDFAKFVLSPEATDPDRLAALIARARQLDVLTARPARVMLDRIRSRWARARRSSSCR